MLAGVIGNNRASAPDPNKLVSHVTAMPEFPAWDAAVRPVRSYSKMPWGFGFTLKGTVADVAVVTNTIHFQFKGWLSIRQYSGTTNTYHPQVVYVDCRNGISAVAQITDFVAEVPNINAAAVRTSEYLLPIFQAAARNDREVAISVDPTGLDFGGQPMIENARVWRITDWDLH